MMIQSIEHLWGNILRGCESFTVVWIRNILAKNEISKEMVNGEQNDDVELKLSYVWFIS